MVVVVGCVGRVAVCGWSIVDVLCQFQCERCVFVECLGVDKLHNGGRRPRHLLCSPPVRAKVRAGEIVLELLDDVAAGKRELLHVGVELRGCGHGGGR